MPLLAPVYEPVLCEYVCKKCHKIRIGDEKQPVDLCERCRMSPQQRKAKKPYHRHGSIQAQRLKRFDRRSYERAIRVRDQGRNWGSELGADPYSYS